MQTFKPQKDRDFIQHHFLRVKSDGVSDRANGLSMLQYNRRSLKSGAGFTLFIAIVTVSIVLAIGISILNITLKEYLLSGLSRDSEMAFYAADSGLECVLYWDAQTPSAFDPITPGTINCMGSGSINVGGDWTKDTFEVSWGNPGLCAHVEVTKYTGGTCPVGVTCTLVESRGYSRACSMILTDPKTVERALRTRY